MEENESKTTDDPSNGPSNGPSKWQPLGRSDRRVVGVLVEKAKTTPDNYPLTLNSLLNGSNQKSNRFPQMQLDEEHVYDALERLRKLKAVAEVQGDGRAPKFRHLLYDWLGVDKFELAVMAELLLRGAQTLGELRGRAARMEPIAGIAELRPIIDSLYQQGLILYLTPPGRGCVVTHALYQEQELAKIRAEYGNTSVRVPVPEVLPDATNDRPTTAERTTAAPAVNRNEANPNKPNPSDANYSDIQALREEVDALKTIVDQLRADVSRLQGS